MQTKFVSLLMDYPQNEPPGDTQKRAALLFPQWVSESPLHYWRPEDSIPSSGLRILIGIATYSVGDLYFLDVLIDSVAPEILGTFRFDVFNVLDCKKMEDFESYFPGVGSVTNTPIAGLWRDGALEEIIRNGLAYKRVADTFGFHFDFNNSPERVALRKLRLI